MAVCRLNQAENEEAEEEEEDTKKTLSDVHPELLETIKALRHVIARDPLAADLQLSLFASAVYSERYASMAQPLPREYDRAGGIDELAEVLDAMPALRPLLEGAASVALAQPVALYLLRWLLMPAPPPKPSLLALTASKVEVPEFAPSATLRALPRPPPTRDCPTPSYLFEVIHPILDEFWRETAQGKKIVTGYIGGSLDYFFSTVHCGVRPGGNMVKIHRNLKAAMADSVPGYGVSSSELGARLLCVAEVECVMEVPGLAVSSAEDDHHLVLRDGKLARVSRLFVFRVDEEEPPNWSQHWQGASNKGMATRSVRSLHNTLSPHGTTFKLPEFKFQIELGGDKPGASLQGTAQPPPPPDSAGPSNDQGPPPPPPPQPPGDSEAPEDPLEPEAQEELEAVEEPEPEPEPAPEELEPEPEEPEPESEPAPEEPEATSNAQGINPINASGNSSETPGDAEIARVVENQSLNQLQLLQPSKSSKSSNPLETPNIATPAGAAPGAEPTPPWHLTHRPKHGSTSSSIPPTHPHGPAESIVPRTEVPRESACITSLITGESQRKPSSKTTYRGSRVDSKNWKKLGGESKEKEASVIDSFNARDQPGPSLEEIEEIRSEMQKILAGSLIKGSKSCSTKVQDDLREFRCWEESFSTYRTSSIIAEELSKKMKYFVTEYSTFEFNKKSPSPTVDGPHPEKKKSFVRKCSASEETRRLREDTRKIELKQKPPPEFSKETVKNIKSRHNTQIRQGTDDSITNGKTQKLPTKQIIHRSSIKDERVVCNQQSARHKTKELADDSTKEEFITCDSPKCLRDLRQEKRKFQPKVISPPEFSNKNDKNIMGENLTQKKQYPDDPFTNKINQKETAKNTNVMIKKEHVTEDSSTEIEVKRYHFPLHHKTCTKTESANLHGRNTKNTKNFHALDETQDIKTTLSAGSVTAGRSPDANKIYSSMEIRQYRTNQREHQNTEECSECKSSSRRTRHGRSSTTPPRIRVGRLPVMSCRYLEGMVMAMFVWAIVSLFYTSSEKK